MKNITHLTLNSGNSTLYEDDSVIMEDVRPLFQEMVKEGKSTGIAHVLDLGVVRMAYDVNYGIYMATLFTDESMTLPVLETMGAATEEGAKILWNLALDSYKTMHHKMPERKCECPEVPFICDVIFPTAILAPHLMMYSGDFTKCFGIEMLKTLVPGHQTDEFNSTCNMNLSVAQMKPVCGHQEGVLFDINDCGISVNVYFKHPTCHEINQFKAEEPFMMKLMSMKGIIFPLLKFGDLNWLDAPYNVHLSRNLTKLKFPTEGKGLAMRISLIDAATGEICIHRLIGLSTEISRKLIDMIKEQMQKPFDIRDYDKKLDAIYATYSTKQMVKMATDSYKLYPNM